MQYEYIVVRTYFGNVARKESDDLEMAFIRGFEFVHASEPVPIQEGCIAIEYILRRPKS